MENIETLGQFNRNKQNEVLDKPEELSNLHENNQAASNLILLLKKAGSDKTKKLFEEML